ncbi:hypothetical protein SAMN05216410_1640 [Sanguibacter gelidistatuariae]|uniref:Metal-independent alpha-mannosidase n=1 Tax=Sanguibacter gelidistatuariae TaxID=1814289 RepID=A0A1G6KPW5_9MICO|nr:hypothetical protein SAMN05216410_1640 [Sanguibacter gelidistatuariae]
MDPSLRDAAAAAVRDGLKDATITEMFLTCLDDTLETTVSELDDSSTFIITGDIPAMWLRDSVTQIRPYLLFAAASPELRRMLRGLIARQAELILRDPYANAFNRTADGRGHQDDLTDLNPWVWERKYEVDSLSYPLQLAYMFWRATGDTSWATPRFAEAARTIVRTIAVEQNHEVLSPYQFRRPNAPAPTDTLTHDGFGPPTAPTGLTWSGFRPSDDACTYGFNIPGNAFAAQSLAQLAELATHAFADPDLSRRALALSTQIRTAIRQHGIVEHPTLGPVYAYEVNGLGDTLLMDDANVPSLLSLPMLGVCPPDDPVYRATRQLVLSPENPYFVEGTHASGIGSPHTPPGHIWPIALCVQGITSTDPDERLRMLTTLRETDGGTGMMHESFLADDPNQFTRKWFSWANSMFCELVLDMVGQPVTALLRPGHAR